MKNFSLGSLAGRIDLNLYPVLTAIEISMVKYLPGETNAGMHAEFKKRILCWSFTDWPKRNDNSVL